MRKFDYDSRFFNVKDTLECGQIFRFRPYKDGYLVFSSDKACYAYNEGNRAVVECEDEDYFRNFFDLGEDYSAIFDFASSCGCPVVGRAAELGRGVRILRQDKIEMLFSFITSQNNMIPRIKKSIERMCSSLGEEREFCGERYSAFPSVLSIASAGAEFFSESGFGYRADYMVSCAKAIADGFDLLAADELSTSELKGKLVSLHGVGPKVADCVCLFGYHRTDSFPVDTWIEKLYREDFGGALTDRKKIASFFTDLFGAYSGYVQQYLFYYKRSLEKSDKGK